MIKKILLTRWQPTFTIENSGPFRKLKLKSATSVIGEFNPDYNPYIGLKLNDDTQTFNLRMNLIPSTNQFSCFDVLECAAEVPPLANVYFDSLDIRIREQQYLGDFTVTIEVEVE